MTPGIKYERIIFIVSRLCRILLRLHTFLHSVHALSFGFFISQLWAEHTELWYIYFVEICFVRRKGEKWMATSSSFSSSSSSSNWKCVHIVHIEPSIHTNIDLSSTKDAGRRCMLGFCFWSFNRENYEFFFPFIANEQWCQICFTIQ